ncbi:MAG: DUF21 domain-containing protein [Planctomycetes bacterium]|nr:DUF21 domain-containing protein [Planctomycetota bacterium]
MSETELMLWYLAAVVGTGGSALFSGLETGIYTINRVRLHVAAHQPRSSAAALEGLIASPNRLLGTLLVATNIANYLTSYAVGTILDEAGYQGWAQVAVDAAIVTPLLFVFGEVIPKDFFRSHSDTITPPFAIPLRLFQRLLTITGVLPLIDGISVLVQKALRQSPSALTMLHPRRNVTQLIKEGIGHGMISPYQSAMIDRVLEMERLTVRDVMAPWASVTSVRENQPPEAVWALADRVSYSRAPLVSAAGEPAGLIDLYDVLMYEPANCPPLRSLAKPLPSIRADLSLRDALRLLQQQRASMALIVDANKRPLGLVTTKDLVEPIIGELEVW